MGILELTPLAALQMDEVTRKMRVKNISCGTDKRFLHIYWKGLIIYTLCTLSLMFIIVLVIITGKQKQCKCPSTNEWLKKMWYICRIKFYLAVENNEIMKCLSKQVELEKIIMRKITQIQKDNCDIFSLLFSVFIRFF